MFCDLVGSTGLARRLDPEELREIIAGYQELCRAAVKRFDGHVAQYLGDGVLAYFGFPHAHEDDAERAVRAALHLHASLAHSTERPGALPVTARVGIHTGLVVVGDLGEGSQQQPLALGETVTIASRLQGIAQPGEVVISHTTLGLAPGLFVTRDLGTPALKGVNDPIRVHAVDRALGMGSRLRSSARLTEIAGREFELGQLRDRWRQVCEGRGQVVAISGEAGIGKSRLVLVLREELAEVSHTWLETRCAPYTSGSALQPVVDLLQATLDFQASETPTERLAKLETGLAQLPGIELDEVVPYLIPLLGLPVSDRHPLPDLGPEVQREKTLQALIAPFLAVVSQQPPLIVFEDLHWADSSTIELIGRLIDQTPTLPLMVVMTFRPNFHPPWPFARSYICPLAVTRLGEEQTRSLVLSAAGEGRLPARIVEEIVARADGVPLFAEELARSVLDSGMVVEQDGRAEFRGSISDLTIPTTLQGSLMARLDRLSAAKSVAQIAATLGREFPYALIEAVADLDVAMLRSGLSQLVEAEIVFQRGSPPESHYTFEHALIQDTAYESQLKSRRKELHANVVRVLEERFADRVDAEPEVIARHCVEGGLAAEAIQYYRGPDSHGDRRRRPRRDRASPRSFGGALARLPVALDGAALCHPARAARATDGPCGEGTRASGRPVRALRQRFGRGEGCRGARDARTSALSHSSRRTRKRRLPETR
jgi:class 3 adenylate cyclase